MSEQAPEAPAGGGGGGGAGSALKRKLGPFPMWAWLVIGAVIIFAYVIIKRQQNSAASQTTAATSADASQIPQFVNQTYTTVTPPPAPVPSPGGGGGGGGAPPPPMPKQPGGPNKPPASRPTQITATGTDMGDINQIARQYGLTEQQLIAANPGLRKLRVHSPNGKSIPLIGSGAPVPKGTVLRIPAV